jgi:hypothetical protein
MQNQSIVLSPSLKAMKLQSPGDGFWYESSAGTGDQRLVVQSEIGDTCVLKPGQSMRITKEVAVWSVSLYDGTASVSANVIVGSGDFNDNNTTIGAISGAVAVSNFPATQPVSGSVAVSNLPATQPVSGTVAVSNLPATQPVSGSVSISGVANVLESLYTITHYYASLASLTANTAVNILPAASNTAGAVVQSVQIATDSTAIAVIAKATAPTSVTDGEILFFCEGVGTVGVVKNMPSKLKVASGLGIWIISTSGSSSNIKSVNVAAL